MSGSRAGANLGQIFNTAVRFYNSGNLGEAEKNCKWMLTIDRNCLPALQLLGSIAFRKGDMAEAVKRFAAAVKIQPRSFEAQINLGQAMMGLGRGGDALKCFDLAVRLSPDNADGHNHLANALMACGRFEEAVPAYQRAVALMPRVVDLRVNLGAALTEAGRWTEAEAELRKAIEGNASHARAWTCLGLVLAEQSRHAEAAECHQRALALQPGYPEALNNLGVVLTKLNRLEEAGQALHAALSIVPAYAEAIANLGYLHTYRGDRDGAAAAFAEALRLKPNLVPALSGMADNLMERRRYDEALPTYQKALATRPNDIKSLLGAAAAWMFKCDLEKARACFDSILACRPDNFTALVGRALALPPILTSHDQIPALRAELTERVAAIPAGTNPLGVLGSLQTFYLGYHGCNDRDIQRAVAEMYLRTCPALGFERPMRASKSRRIRVGFVSDHLGGHTVGKLNHAFIKHLDREMFQVVVVRTQPASDDMSREIDGLADRVSVVSTDLELAQQQIAAQEFDVLFYPDIGMEPFTYYLAFARLAPVQVTTWGHPVTTGIPNMDYFLSSEALEPADGQDHYTETLVRMKTLPTVYYRPDPPAQPKTRAQLGLPETGRLYVCPQTLFKFHPDFDRILGDILRGDPQGRVVVIAGQTTDWDKALKRRWKTVFPEHINRVVFVPALPHQDFLALMIHADALLDPVHFTGGLSTSEALGLGLPIVTMEGEFMRGRVTQGCYRLMGLDDLVTTNAGEYVAMALRLAGDPAYRAEVAGRIRETSAVLFDNLGAVRELEQFFVDAVGTARARLPAAS